MVAVGPLEEVVFHDLQISGALVLQVELILSL